MPHTGGIEMNEIVKTFEEMENELKKLDNQNTDLQRCCEEYYNRARDAEREVDRLKEIISYNHGLKPLIAMELGKMKKPDNNYEAYAKMKSYVDIISNDHKYGIVERLETFWASVKEDTEDIKDNATLLYCSAVYLAENAITLAAYILNLITEKGEQDDV